VLLSQNGSALASGLEEKWIVPQELGQKVQEIKASGKTIATLNGSFDLLHAGHLEIIYQASLQADVLIVALNTDESIQQYKSPLRPIIPLEYRRQMMAALQFVDYVTWFSQTDPREILETIAPNVHVNGSEYGENCIEAEVVKKLGGRLHIVSLVPGLSTSEIIRKIVDVCG
jgi:rfaE bifunctional protein nucleotidyltransferase chain/domain